MPWYGNCSVLLALYGGIHQWLVDSSHKGPVCWTFGDFLLARTNHWTKNGVVGWLTHWGKVTHICVSNLTIIGSDNGLSPDRRQAIIWTNAGILLIGPLGISFNENLIGIQTFLFYKMHLKMSSAKWRPFCLGLNVLLTPWDSCDVSAILLATCSHVYKICNVSTNANI